MNSHMAEARDARMSFAEVKRAEEVFKREVQRLAPGTELPKGAAGYISVSTMISCALAEVWRAGRKYQRDQVDTKYRSNNLMDAGQMLLSGGTVE